MTDNKEPITALKGIGEKTAALFAKLQILTIADLLADYPREYQIYEEPLPAGRLPEEGFAAVGGLIRREASQRYYQGKSITMLTLQDETGSVQLSWFNAPYLRSALVPGSYHIFYGRVSRRNHRLVMDQPEIFSREEYAQRMARYQPIYNQTKGLGNKAIIRAVTQALEIRTLEREYLPGAIRQNYELAERNYAVEHIHFPESREELLAARKRLVFDEFFFFILQVRRLKAGREEKPSDFPCRSFLTGEKLIGALPYQLTGDQQKVYGEICRDLSSGHVMNRLIQGDVGSGKTILALLALLAAWENGYQGALMAPTEVLARQHYESILTLFAAQGIECRVELLTGSMTAKEKRESYARIAAHETDLVIGTHALIQEGVSFDRLGLVITDEQHRFGVHQRETLGKKGGEPHILVMSATPIPRTLAIILYGDLDISVIRELPAERLPVRTALIGPDSLEKAYTFIRKEAGAGHQIYCICPMVEPNELIEAENVTDYQHKLAKAFPEFSCALLHGKLKAKEKNRIMQEFADGRITILVSTTVVEVGVNVPNATVMLIENAERFGLAQLHQLRGRVGRGAAQSYCILVNHGDGGAAKRLEVLRSSNDGFMIASEDLRLRGPGDVFGIRQSGDMEFRIGDIFTDAEVLKAASEEAGRILKEDPSLEAPEHAGIREHLQQLRERTGGEINL